jgi:hypothetical protein
MPLAGTGPALGRDIYNIIMDAHKQTDGVDQVNALAMWQAIGTKIVEHIISHANVTIGEIQPPSATADWTHSHSSNTSVNKIL